jgi:protein-disulfide isomerase
MDEEKSITLKKSTIWKSAAVVFGVLFVLSLFGVFNFGGGNGSGDVAPTQPSGTTGSVKVQIEENDPVLGDADAGISIVEFSDFQCPFCARAFEGAITDFKNSDYFNNGEVNLVYKHFPLNSIHPFAQKAAEASLCAHDQNEFWRYHDTLFANQGSLDVSSLKTYAMQLGLDVDEFNSCLDDGDKQSEVNKELAQATAAGGRGTPYFVIINNDNGDTAAVSGAVPWSNFEAAINSVK